LTVDDKTKRKALENGAEALPTMPNRVRDAAQQN
jgi:hypothetical protein